MLFCYNLFILISQVIQGLRNVIRMHTYSIGVHSISVPLSAAHSLSIPLFLGSTDSLLFCYNVFILISQVIQGLRNVIRMHTYSIGVHSISVPLSAARSLSIPLFLGSTDSLAGNRDLCKASVTYSRFLTAVVCGLENRHGPF